MPQANDNKFNLGSYTRILYIGSMSYIKKLTSYLTKSKKAISINVKNLEIKLVNINYQYCHIFKISSNNQAHEKNNIIIVFCYNNNINSDFIRCNYFHRIFFDYNNLNYADYDHLFSQSSGSFKAQKSNKNINSNSNRNSNLNNYKFYPDEPYQLKAILAIPKNTEHLKLILDLSSSSRGRRRSNTNNSNAKKTDIEILDIIMLNPKSISIAWHSIESKIKNEFQTRTNKINAKIGLAITGGGVLGFLYSLGVICAIDQLFVNKSSTNFHAYAGTSSGSFLVALLALGISADKIRSAVTKGYGSLPKLSSKILYDLTPQNLINLHQKKLKSISLNDLNFLQKLIFGSFGDGIFLANALEEYFCTAGKYLGVGCEYQDLQSKLFIGITDRDNFEHKTICYDPDQIKKNPTNNLLKLSKAVKASSAIPFIYTPVKTSENTFIDGQISRCADIKKLISAGCKLIIIINPLVPYSQSLERSKVSGFYYLMQSVKSMLFSRLMQTISTLKKTYNDVDFILLQPDDQLINKMKGSPMTKNVDFDLIAQAKMHTLEKFKTFNQYYKPLCNYHNIKLFDY